MSFLWPSALFSLLLLAALPFAYVWLINRRKRAVKVASLDLIREAVGRQPSLRRHLPPALMYLALLLMAFALGRPTAMFTVPSERASIVLAIDISGSMRAQDVEPSRMEAAQAAARSFVADQPRNVKIGVVAFSTDAMIVQMPTVKRDDVLAAIDGLYPQRYTAVGRGLLASLQALLPELELDFSTPSDGEPVTAPLGTRPDAVGPIATTPVAPGSYTSAVIVLLSDGQTNAGIRPLDAARIVADRGIRVYTIGFGSPEGGVIDFRGGSMRVLLDEKTLKDIADITRGRYYNARTGADLRDIYNALSTQLVTETKRTELTSLMAAPALILLLLAIILSLIWSNRMT